LNTGTTSWVVEQSAPGVRMDVYVKGWLGDVSRGTIQRLMEEGCLRVNGKVVKSTQEPRAGDRVEIQWPEPKVSEVVPEAVVLEVLWEDDDLLVINKPPGMVVHPSVGHESGTLVNALLHYCAGRLSGIGGVARPGIVHRLDRDTSGCLVVAKHDGAHVGLTAQFARRDLEKTYQAILCGTLPHDVGEMRGAIARHPTDRKRMAVVEGGRVALTSYAVRERMGGGTWVEAGLHTGRTHQIRVHFRQLGYPVFGDEVYGAKATLKLAEATGHRPARQLLHAWRLEFRHPRDEALVRVEAPLPEDFTVALEALRRGG
jgi:23S rRNA pseudouridine1911/1915/1917 synthase